MNKICEDRMCVGCSACFNVCPTKSILMKEDAQGFLYPTIDSNTCIDCGLCRKVCLAFGENHKCVPEKVYAAINKNEGDYITSTSGGIATLFSKKIISSGGVVYGAAVCDNMEVKHIRVDRIEDVERLKGSKYVQSVMGDSYFQVRTDLKKEKIVLFIGTPCQIMGLRKFLGKSYDNLYLCDIVCHGVPSGKMLRDHIVAVTDGKRAERISFRDSEGFYLKVYNNVEEIYHKKNFYDVYYIGFLKGLFYRECCYNCDFAESKRVGDVTLGDFWGFNSEKKAFPIKATKGLSLILINTENGKKLLELCDNELIKQERSLEEAVNGNKQLRKPSEKHKKYDSFKKIYKKKGFEKAAKYLLWKERIAYAVLDKLGR